MIEASRLRPPAFSKREEPFAAPWRTTAVAGMGTAIRVTVPPSAPRSAVREVLAWMRHVEDTFSTFAAESVISRVGRGELAVGDAPPEVRHVLARCTELEESTGGRFTIRHDGDTIDPAGFVKGWSVDEAALILLGHGVDDFSIYAGGDVLCSGSPPGGGGWRVGIRHPSAPAGIVTAIEVDGGAVATSGSYFRGRHIRGSDAGRLLSVTVTGPSLGTADALATAIFSAQDDRLDWLVAHRGYEVVLVCADGMLRRTDGIRLAVSATRASAMGERDFRPWGPSVLG